MMMEHLFSQLCLAKNESSDNLMAIESGLSASDDFNTMVEHSTLPMRMENSTPNRAGPNLAGVEIDNRGGNRSTFRTSEKLIEETANRDTAFVTRNNIFINNNAGTIVMAIPGEKTPITNNPDGYSTPEDNVHEMAGNVSCSTTNHSKPGSRLCPRALDFSTAATAKHRTSPKSRKTLKRVSNSQRQIPFPCRKTKAFGSAYKRALSETIISGGLINRVENNFYINKNSGTIITGNNNKVSISEIKQLGKDEVLEVDGPCGSISPQKPIKVIADDNYESFLMTFYELTNRLHPLRDNGRFDDFYREAEEISRAYTDDSHIKIITMIEISVALSYQKQFDESERMIDQAIKMISNLGVEMKNFLLVYSHCHRTGLQRRLNRSWEANYSVVTAMQNEEFVPFCVARVFVVYEQASNLTKELSLISVTESEPRQVLMEEAKKKLKECVSLADKLLEEHSFIYLKRHQFSLVKLALMILNCRTKTSRSQAVDEESIQEADRCIRRMEALYGDDMSEAITIQLFTAKCDLCFRRKDFCNAERYARQALKTATINNFSLEIKPIQERLDDINCYQFVV